MAKFKKNLIVSEKNYSGSGVLSKISFSGKLYLAIFFLCAGLLVQCLLVVSSLYEYRNEFVSSANLRNSHTENIRALRNLSRNLMEKNYYTDIYKVTVDASGDLAQIQQALNNFNDNIFSKPITKVEEIINQFVHNGSYLYTHNFSYNEQLIGQYRMVINDLEKVAFEYYHQNYQEVLVALIIKFAIALLVLVLNIIICKWLSKCAIQSVDIPADRIIKCLQGSNGDLNVKIPVLTMEGLGGTGRLLNDGISKWSGLALEFKTASNKLNYLVEELTAGFHEIFLLETQLQGVYSEIETSFNQQEQMGKKVDAEIETIVSDLSNLQYLPRKVGEISEEVNSLLAVNKENLSGLINRRIDSNNESHDIINYLKELESTSERVDRIMKELEEIEAESEMLAFNSAISAARAGDEGQGFSVVAKEIANLVERSKKASGNLSGLIGQIKTKTEQIVSLTPENDLLEQGELSLEKTVNSICSNLNETAIKFLTEINNMRQVAETIFIKSNEAFAEISSISDSSQAQGDTNDLKNINDTIGRYIESIKNTGEISANIRETVNKLQSATNQLLNRNT